MFNIERFQDGQIPDVPLRIQYYDNFIKGNVDGAHAIYNNSPQLRGKVVTAQMLNQLLESLLTLEGFYDIDVTQFLEKEKNRFQLNINELIYMRDFNPTEQYEINNFVIYTDIIYYCKLKPPVGTSPTNKTYWIELKIKGDTGAPTLGLVYKGEWNPSSSYKYRDMVVLNNNLYVAYSDNVNKNPVTNVNIWLLAVEMIPSKIIISKEQPLLNSGDVWFRVLN